MKRSSLLTSAAVLSAAGLSAAAGAVLRRILRHGAVEQALRASTGDADTGQLPVVPEAGGTPASPLPGWRESLPVTPVPPNTVTATVPEPAGTGNSAAAARSADGRGSGGEPGTDSDSEEPKPARTWVVDNSSDWDGNPLELVVTPARARLLKGQPGAGLA
ncbi:hypothetical protein [Arthrobacter sp. Z1-15]